MHFLWSVNRFSKVLRIFGDIGKKFTIALQFFVDQSLYSKTIFQPRRFNHELFNPMVQKFIVEKSQVEKFMVEKSGVEAWGRIVQGWNVLQPVIWIEPKPGITCNDQWITCVKPWISENKSSLFQSWQKFLDKFNDFFVQIVYFCFKIP